MNHRKATMFDELKDQEKSLLCYFTAYSMFVTYN
jgi:hypothetical protein